jgi:outer membrane protein OmpA-like peptidoglycan-associated protein
VAYLIPVLVAKLTPGGSMPSQLPAEVTTFIGDAPALLATPAAGAGHAGGAGAGLTKWLPWLIGAVIVLLGLSYCAKRGDAPATDTPAQTAPASEAGATPPAESASQDGAAPASEGAATPAAGDASAPASAASAAVVLEGMPEGAAVVAGEAHGVPLLQVFFDSGKTTVADEFAAKSAAMVEYLKANADAKAVISGFNDPTGDAARNAELSKQRAQAVQAALVAQGIEEGRTVLEKPVDPAGTAVSNAAARRVDVVVRR